MEYDDQWNKYDQPENVSNGLEMLSTAAQMFEKFETGVQQALVLADSIQQENRIEPVVHRVAKEESTNTNDSSSTEEYSTSQELNVGGNDSGGENMYSNLNAQEISHGGNDDCPQIDAERPEIHRDGMFGNNPGYFAYAGEHPHKPTGYGVSSFPGMEFQGPVSHDSNQPNENNFSRSRAQQPPDPRSFPYFYPFYNMYVPMNSHPGATGNMAAGQFQWMTPEQIQQMRMMEMAHAQRMAQEQARSHEFVVPNPGSSIPMNLQAGLDSCFANLRNRMYMERGYPGVSEAANFFFAGGMNQRVPSVQVVKIEEVGSDEDIIEPPKRQDLYEDISEWSSEGSNSPKPKVQGRGSKGNDKQVNLGGNGGSIGKNEAPVVDITISPESPVEISEYSYDEDPPLTPIPGIQKAEHFMDVEQVGALDKEAANGKGNGNSGRRNVDKPPISTKPAMLEESEDLKGSFGTNISLQGSVKEEPSVPLPTEDVYILPKPVLRVNGPVTNVIDVSWKLRQEEMAKNVASYELFAAQGIQPPDQFEPEDKMLVVRATCHQMGCVLTNYAGSRKYHFVVRVVYKDNTAGPTSDVLTVFVP